MKTNILIDISPPIPFLGKFWFLSYRAGCCLSIKLQDSLKCNISRKKWMMKFITGKQINVEIFYNLVLLFWACLARHVQSSQIVFLSLQYLQKNVENEVDLLPTYKHKSFLQVGSIPLSMCSQAYPKYPK